MTSKSFVYKSYKDISAFTIENFMPEHSSL